MKRISELHFLKALLILLVINLSSCASLPGPTEKHDPWERFNRSMYNFNDKVDRAILKPVAKGYKKVTPDPVEKGISNFFSNLGEIKVIVNDLLQFKFGQALSDTGRFLVNSTIGIYGLFDVAKHMKLEKHDEDFGQTLGRWGVKPGPYLVLPLIGPSTLRDGTGFVVDRNLDPIREVEDDSTRISLYALDIVQTRAELLEASNLLDEAALDPYIFIREAYLQQRSNKVSDEQKESEQNLDEDDYDDIFSEDDDL